MTKYVEWMEPYDCELDVVCTVKVSVEDAIKLQKKVAGKEIHQFVYDNDEQALDDFICVHWGRIVEEE